MGRVFREELCAARVPERDFDELCECFLERLQLLGGDALEEHVAVAVLLHVFRQEPEVVVRVRHHIGQREFLFLRKVD